MILAIRITLLVFAALFFLAALSAKEEKRAYIEFGAGAIITVLLLASMKIM